MCRWVGTVRRAPRHRQHAPHMPASMLGCPPRLGATGCPLGGVRGDGQVAALHVPGSVCGSALPPAPPRRGTAGPRGDWPPTCDQCPRPSPASGTGRLASTAQSLAVLCARCRPGPELGAGSCDPRTRREPCLPGPHLGCGRERQSRPYGQSISVLISQAPGKGWAQDGPPGSLGLGRGRGGLGSPVRVLAGGSCPSQSPASRCLSQGSAVCLSTSHLVTLNLQEACGTSPEPCALIYVLLLWGIFFKNRMDVRKTTMPQNHT